MKKIYCDVCGNEIPIVLSDESALNQYFKLILKALPEKAYGKEYTTLFDLCQTCHERLLKWIDEYTHKGFLARPKKDVEWKADKEQVVSIAVSIKKMRAEDKKEKLLKKMKAQEAKNKRYSEK